MCSIGFISGDTAGQGSMLMLFLFNISLQHEALHYHASILQAHAFEGKEQERNSFRLQNLVHVTLSIEVALHNNEIYFSSAHNATPYHNTPTSKSVPLNETIIEPTAVAPNGNAVVPTANGKPDDVL